jgi:predicted house-cleaning noncanonical NTP pyrophosphatase (MazG superfamily)
MGAAMVETVPEDVANDLNKACALHQRASSDYKKCLEFNKLMSDILERLEDADCFRAADRVMTILLDCNPRDGAHCDKATLIGDKMKKFEKG